MAQYFTKPIYNTKRWKVTREQILMRDNYMCQSGKLTEKECLNPAEEVHHIKELTRDNINDFDIVYGDENLISLCKDCHNKIHNRFQGDNKNIECDTKFVFDSAGRLVPVSPP